MSCPDCFRGGKATGSPKGTLETIHGHSTYVAGPAPASPNVPTIIFFTDAFGLRLENNKLLADAYTIATGFRVLVPDIVPGGGMNPAVIDHLDIVMAPVPFWNLLGWARRAYHLVVGLSHAVPFMRKAKPNLRKECYEPCLAYARAVRAEMADDAKLGVAGFCWGGYQSVNLCKETRTPGGKEPLIDAQFCAHPSSLKLPNDIVEAVMTFKTPVAVAHATNDMALKNEVVHNTEAQLREKTGDGKGAGGFHWEIKYYEDVPHGFAVRARDGFEKEAVAADDAKAQAIEFFKRWL
jgi:dienelactone hydrolase